MAEKVKVWFYPETDFLEVRFSDALGTCARRNMRLSWSGWTNMGRSSVLVFSGLVGFVKSVLLKRNWPAVSETIDFDAAFLTYGKSRSVG